MAQQQYFSDKAFTNYLAYLRYWKQPEYAKFLKFPQCLHFLDLLQGKAFRDELVNKLIIDFISEQQFYHWMHYYQKRSAVGADADAGSVTSGSAPALD